MVWALRALANGVQPQVVEEIARARESIFGGKLQAQPFRKPGARFKGYLGSHHLQFVIAIGFLVWRLRLRVELRFGRRGFQLLPKLFQLSGIKVRQHFAINFNDRRKRLAG